MAAVRFLHVSNGFTDPLRDRPRIKLALRAVGLEGSGPKQKLPITHKILAAIKPFSLSRDDDYTRGLHVLDSHEFMLFRAIACLRIHVLHYNFKV